MFPFYFPYHQCGGGAPMTANEVKEKLIEIMQPTLADWQNLALLNDLVVKSLEATDE